MRIPASGVSRPVPREAPGRCAPQADRRGDPMVGTAMPSARLLLVEQPGPWGPRGLLDSHADPDLAREVDERAAAAGMRLLAVRRPERHHDREGPRSVAVVDTVTRLTHRWTVGSLPELVAQLRASEATEPAGARAALLAQPPEVVEDTGATYLVCTHGTHDACCAVRGRPLVDALHAIRPGRVWETTHVGGDRFAANLVLAPSGDAYGRVAPALVADLVAHVERGEVVPALMRGRIGLSPVVQTALVHAHARLGLAARDAVEVLGSTKLTDDLAAVTLGTPTGPVRVEVEISVGPAAQLTCRGPATARARVHRGAGITPISPTEV